MMQMKKGRITGQQR